MPSASPIQVVRGLEAIIDAAAGVLAEQSLTATLNGMARALGAIVPFTSLAIYEADHRARVLVPVFAVGRYVEQTLADRPPFDASIGGSVVRSREMAHIELPDPRLSRYRSPTRRSTSPRRWSSCRSSSPTTSSGRSACGARGSSGRGLQPARRS